MFRLRLTDCLTFQLLMPLAVACVFSVGMRAQEASPVTVKFSFHTTAVDTRFEQSSKPDIEKEVSAELAKSCGKRFPFWTFKSADSDFPTQLEAWVSLKDSTWSLMTDLKHPGGKVIKDNWSTVLYAPGDLDGQVLPKDHAWTAKLKSAFENLLQGESQNEILGALQEFAPLGTQMAGVPTQTTAVLSLDFGKYQVLSMSAFRILCNWAGHGVVVLHSTGTGAANDFTPDNPQYKGIWVMHNMWEFAGKTEDVSAHAGDFSSLKALAFYLEKVNSPPPDVSIAP